MRASLNEIRTIEQYLTGRMLVEDRLVLEAKALVDPSLASRIGLQKKIHDVLRLYHRRKLKRRAEEIHTVLFTDPSKTSFRKSILQLFE